MDFGDAPDEAAFRLRLRDWLVDNDPGLPASSTDDAYWAGQAAWHQSLYDGGFFGTTWSTDIGGQDLPSVYDVIVDEELAAAGAPPRPSLGYLVEGILEHGSDDVQRRFLPGIVNGRDRWCQGFSEPDAGSDLASLRTRADRDGDEYVLTGHKVWTSYSDDADWCLVLARTDHDVAKHKGISAFAVPMRQPGIEQRPLPMINGITKEFGEVLFDGARVPAANMIGEPGDGWPLAMTVVSHEREPHELGFAGRYQKLVKELIDRVRRDPSELQRRAGPRAGLGHRRDRDVAPARVPPAVGPPRRHLARPRGIGGQVAHDLDRADRRPRRAGRRRRGVRRRGRHVAEGVPLQSGPERHGRHLADPTEPGRRADPGTPRVMTTYDVTDELEVEVDGPILVIRLNRPEQLNATNHGLHHGLADLFPQIDADDEVRAVVLTGNGRAFSAGGDFTYLDELAEDGARRRETLADGKQIVTGMVRCRVPIVAAVNGPAVGLGCSLVALSDIVFMAESAYLADPHVMLGLVAADGGPVTWPLLTSLQLAKEYAFTGDRIPARRAAEMGLANHVCPDDEVVDQAVACARRIAKLPRQAVEDTKRILNLHLERAVVATLDFALAAEDRSFTSPELRANLDRLLKPRDGEA